MTLAVPAERYVEWFECFKAAAEKMRPGLELQVRRDRVHARGITLEKRRGAGYVYQLWWCDGPAGKRLRRGSPEKRLRAEFHIPKDKSLMNKSLYEYLEARRPEIEKKIRCKGGEELEWNDKNLKKAKPGKSAIWLYHPSPHRLDEPLPAAEICEWALDAFDRLKYAIDPLLDWFDGAPAGTSAAAVRSGPVEIARLDDKPPAALEYGTLASEGVMTRDSVNRYKRSDRARQECIELRGAMCQVCDLEFGQRYGEFAQGFIHVHHIEPLSQIEDRENYRVNPRDDLVPVCPNCHAMLHLGVETPRSVEELKHLMDDEG